MICDTRVVWTLTSSSDKNDLVWIPDQLIWRGLMIRPASWNLTEAEQTRKRMAWNASWAALVDLWLAVGLLTSFDCHSIAAWRLQVRTRSISAVSFKKDYNNTQVPLSSKQKYHVLLVLRHLLLMVKSKFGKISWRRRLSWGIDE